MKVWVDSLHPCNRQQVDRLKVKLATSARNVDVISTFKFQCREPSWQISAPLHIHGSFSSTLLLQKHHWHHWHRQLTKLHSVVKTLLRVDNFCCWISVLLLFLTPKTCFWHTVGYGSILLRDMIYIYIQTYIHIYILNNEVANPVNSGLNIGYTILMYLICQTTVSNGGILLPHNWEKGLGRRKQYVGTSPGHRHWQCLEGLLFQRRQMIEAKHRDHPSLSTVTWRGSTPKCIHRPNRMCWQKPGS